MSHCPPRETTSPCTIHHPPVLDQEQPGGVVSSGRLLWLANEQPNSPDQVLHSLRVNGLAPPGQVIAPLLLMEPFTTLYSSSAELSCMLASMLASARCDSMLFDVSISAPDCSACRSPAAANIGWSVFPPRLHTLQRLYLPIIFKEGRTQNLAGQHHHGNVSSNIMVSGSQTGGSTQGDFPAGFFRQRGSPQLLGSFAHSEEAGPRCLPST